jgi:hypothetical protein
MDNSPHATKFPKRDHHDLIDFLDIFAFAFFFFSFFFFFVFSKSLMGVIKISYFSTKKLIKINNLTEHKIERFSKRYNFYLNLDKEMIRVPNFLSKNTY